MHADGNNQIHAENNHGKNYQHHVSHNENINGGASHTVDHKHNSDVPCHHSKHLENHSVYSHQQNINSPAMSRHQYLHSQISHDTQGLQSSALPSKQKDAGQLDLSQRLYDHIERHSRYNQQLPDGGSQTDLSYHQHSFDGLQTDLRHEVLALNLHHQLQKQSSDHNIPQSLDGKQEQPSSPVITHFEHCGSGDSRQSNSSPIQKHSPRQFSLLNDEQYNIKSDIQDSSLDLPQLPIINLHESLKISKQPEVYPHLLFDMKHQRNSPHHEAQEHHDDSPSSIPIHPSETSRAVHNSNRSQNNRNTDTPPLQTHLTQCNHTCKTCLQVVSNSNGLDYHQCVVLSGSAILKYFPRLDYEKESLYIADSSKPSSSTSVDGEVMTRDGALLKQCDVCDQFYKDQECLDVHMLKEHSSKTNVDSTKGDKVNLTAIHNCILCECTFKSQRMLHSHERSHHPNTHLSNKKVPDTCTATPNKRGAPLLTCIVTTDGRHLCEVCSKSYRSRSILRTHRITHRTSKPYTCDTCQQGFNSFSNLRNHQFKHTGRKFPCPHCGKSYSSPGNLKTHLIKLHGAGL